MMHDSLNISEHTHHVLLNKSLTISDTKQHTHTQLFIHDSWCTSSMYLHPQRKRNPTRSLQPATLLALRIAVVHCLPPAASFRHPAKERNSAGIQWQFGHNCRNQIKLYIAIWKLNMLELHGIASNIFKWNMKSTIPYLENPREPLLEKTHSLFILAPQNCRNSPSLFIYRSRSLHGPCSAWDTVGCEGGCCEGFGSSLSSFCSVFSNRQQQCQACCQELPEVELAESNQINPAVGGSTLLTSLVDAWLTELTEHIPRNKTFMFSDTKRPTHILNLFFSFSTLNGLVVHSRLSMAYQSNILPAPRKAEL